MSPNNKAGKVDEVCGSLVTGNIGFGMSGTRNGIAIIFT
jgi:hypothetical protein